MTTWESEAGRRVQVVLCDSVRQDDGVKKVVVDLIPPQPAIKVMSEVNRRVIELERDGIDLCFFFFPGDDELLAFRRDGNRLQMVGKDGPNIQMFNSLLDAFREAVEMRVRAEVQAERLAARLRAAGIDPDGVGAP